MTEQTPEMIRLTADVVAVAPGADGRPHVLLIRRRWEPYQGCWALPGGHVDAGEDAATAAARELAEETGLAVDAEALTALGAWHTPGRDPRGRYVTLAYRATLPEIVAPVAADDATHAHWWPVPIPATLAVAFDHREIIRTAVPHARVEIDPVQLAAIRSEIQRALDSALHAVQDKDMSGGALSGVRLTQGLVRHMLDRIARHRSVILDD